MLIEFHQWPSCVCASTKCHRHHHLPHRPPARHHLFHLPHLLHRPPACHHLLHLPPTHHHLLTFCRCSSNLPPPVWNTSLTTRRQIEGKGIKLWLSMRNRVDRSRIIRIFPFRRFSQEMAAFWRDNQPDDRFDRHNHWDVSHANPRLAINYQKSWGCLFVCLLEFDKYKYK